MGEFLVHWPAAGELSIAGTMPAGLILQHLPIGSAITIIIRRPGLLFITKEFALDTAVITGKSAPDGKVCRSGKVGIKSGSVNVEFPCSRSRETSSASRFRAKSRTLTSSTTRRLTTALTIDAGQASQKRR
jgi:hypothetical protein